MWSNKASGRAFAALLACVLLVQCAPAGGPAASGGAGRAPAPAAPAAGAPSAAAPQPQAAGNPPAKLRVGLATDTLGRAPLYVAERKGYLRDVGIELERIYVEGDTRLLAAFFANEVELAGFGADTVVKMVGEGRDVQIVYGMGEGQDVHLIVSKRFAEQRGADPSAELRDKVGRLKGITIGAPSLGGLGELRSRWVLAKGGLQEADVTVVQVGGGPAQIAATENDQIDGFTAPPLAPQQAVARGKSVVLVRPTELPEHAHFLHTSLSASKASAERNRDALRQLAQAMNQAKRYIQDDFDGAAQALKNDFPNVPDEILRDGLAIYRPTFGTDGKMSVATWRDTLNFLRDGGILRGDLDPAEGIFWTNAYQP